MFNIAIISVLKEVRRCHSSNPVTKTTATPTQIKPPPSEGWMDSVGLDYQESRLPFDWSQRRAITLIACRKQKSEH